MVSCLASARSTQIRRSTSLNCIVILSIFLLFVSAFAAARAESERRRFAERCRTRARARVARAQVVVESAGSSITREATANDRGEFRIEGLLPGSLSRHRDRQRFCPSHCRCRCRRERGARYRGHAHSRNGRARPSMCRAILPRLPRETIDTASAVRGGVVGSQDLETLPLPARSFANIAYLVPGTEPVEPSDPTKARITAVSTGGSSGLNNELSVDGADNSDDWIGGFLQNFSPDGIQEFAVRTSNEDADTGWTTAGSVVITTKHGTNDWHGDARFLRARRQRSMPVSRLRIRRPIPSSRSRGRTMWARWAGRSRKTKYGFFTSFENVHENASIAYSPASTPQFDALAGLSDVSQRPYIYPIPGVPRQCRSAKRSHPLPRLHRLGAF